MADQIFMPRATDANDDPVSGAEAYFYESGTTTPQTVYSDDGLTTAHPTPLVADGNGTFPQVFVTAATQVKVDVQDGGVSLPGYPFDPVFLWSTDSSAASRVTFSPITGNVATNVQAAIANLTALWNAVTAYGKSLIAAADAAAARTVLGLAAGATAAKADQATAEAGTDDSDYMTSLKTKQAIPIRAWVNFDGTGTPSIRSSANVTSITKLGTGHYRINFTDAMADTDYAYFIGGTDAVGGSAGFAYGSELEGGTVKAAGSLEFKIGYPANSAAFDMGTVNVMILG